MRRYEHWITCGEGERLIPETTADAEYEKIRYRKPRAPGK
jgi:hypothetical protein